MNIKRLKEKDDILKEILVGKYFLHEHHVAYVLSMTNTKCDTVGVTLISLRDGNRFRDPVFVCNRHEMCESEIDSIFGNDTWCLIGNYDDFIKYIKEK